MRYIVILSYSEEERNINRTIPPVAQMMVPLMQGKYTMMKYENLRIKLAFLKASSSSSRWCLLNSGKISSRTWRIAEITTLFYCKTRLLWLVLTSQKHGICNRIWDSVREQNVFNMHDAHIVIWIWMRIRSNPRNFSGKSFWIWFFLKQ